MPTPRVRVPAPQVSNAALPGVQLARPNAAGAAFVARGLQDATEAAARVEAVERREREDALAIHLEELEGQFTKTATAGLTSLGSQQGRNASAASVPFYDSLETLRGQLLEKVDDERARRVLDVRLGKIISSARASGEAHVAKQDQVADDTSFSLLKGAAKDRIALEAFDPALQAALRGAAPDTGEDGPVDPVTQLAPHLRAYAQRKGLSPQDTALLEAQWRGEATEIVMNRLISAGRYEQARALLADPAIRKNLGDQVGTFDGQLTRDERDAAGSAAARGFVRAATNREGYFDRDAAQRELDALLASDEAPEVKKAAEQEFTAAATRADQAWNARLSDTADSALTKIINAGGSTAAAAAERRWLLRDDVKGGKVWAAIEAQATAWANRDKPETTGQKSAMVDFLVALPGNVQRYAAKPEAFKLEWLGRLSQKDLERAAAMVAVQGIAARKPDETLSPSVLAAVTAMGHKAGKWGKAGPKSPEQKELYYTLHSELLGKQAELKVAGTAAAKMQEDLLAYARGRLREGRVLGTGTFRDDRTTELEASTAPGYADKIFIPEELEDQYVEKLRKRGYPTDDEWIRWMHLASQGVPDEFNPPPGKPPPPTGPGGMTPEQGAEFLRARGASTGSR